MNSKCVLFGLLNIAINAFCDICLICAKNNLLILPETLWADNFLCCILISYIVLSYLQGLQKTSCLCYGEEESDASVV